MEIKIENRIKLDSNQVIGIIDSSNYLLNYIKKINFSKNNISVDGKKLNQSEIINFKRKISIVNNYIDTDSYNMTVYEYMRYYIYTNMLDIKDYNKKIEDSLKIVGLREGYKDKKLITLSKSEQQWISFAISLLSNPDVLLLNNIFNSLDIKNTKKINKLIQQLVENYNKIVIVYTKNSECIYQNTKKTIILDDAEVLIEGLTENIFQDNYELLIKNGVKIPKTIEFSIKVNKNKNAKIGYFKDIRDLIKDIYKKV